MAQVTVNSTNSFYRESGGGLNSMNINPSFRIRGDIKDRATIRAGWEADVVSGASVAVVDAPSSDVDAITSATKFDDFRNTASGGFSLHSDYATIDLDYSFGIENDYRSHGFSIGARSELFERNTTFEVSYARGFDSICNLAQPRAQEAVDRQRMPSSDGCFEAEDREELKLDLHTFQAGWTQAWAPVFATQVILTAQVLNGYQGNPYRAVWLGRSAAQEHHPENRARFAAGLGMRLWLKPFNGALQLFGRVYRDSWDILSGTVELAYQQRLAEGLSLRARGRYYNQTGAAFFSDNYVLFPRGQYFTGDRELSPMSNWLVGGQLEYDIPPNDEGSVGIFDGFTIVAKFDFIKYDFREFRYGQVAVPNNTGILATLGLDARF